MPAEIQPSFCTVRRTLASISAIVGLVIPATVPCTTADTRLRQRPCISEHVTTTSLTCQPDLERQGEGPTVCPGSGATGATTGASQPDNGVTLDHGHPGVLSRRCIQRRQAIDRAYWSLALKPAVAVQAAKLASAATSEPISSPLSTRCQKPRASARLTVRSRLGGSTVCTNMCISARACAVALCCTPFDLMGRQQTSHTRSSSDTSLAPLRCNVSSLSY